MDLVTNFVFFVVWIFSLSETLRACAYLCISVKSQKSTEVEEKRRELLKMQALPPLPRDQPFDEDEQDEQLNAFLNRPARRRVSQLMGYHMLPHVTTNGKGIYHGRSE